MKNYIEWLRNEIANCKDDERLIDLTIELAEKEGYKTLEDLEIEY